MPATHIADIPGMSALSGIAELDKDVRLDTRNFAKSRDGSVLRPATVSLVTMVPEAVLFNGMTHLASNDTTTLLIADTTTGTIMRLNVDTNHYEVVMADPTMASTPAGLGYGPNGIRTHDDRLFSTSVDQGLFAAIPISLSDGRATGPVEIIISGSLTTPDDFVLSRDGKKAWIAQNLQNNLIEVDIASGMKRVAANSTILGSPSSLALGRTRSDRNVLSITGTRQSSGVAVGSLFRMIQDPRDGLSAIKGCLT
ncbi:hypothetical protein ACJZ2D_006293 [Fusarium nematophilum]